MIQSFVLFDLSVLSVPYNNCLNLSRFMRHKVKLTDRFMAHKEHVLELGKDVSGLDFYIFCIPVDLLY